MAQAIFKCNREMSDFEEKIAAPCQAPVSQVVARERAKS